MLTRIFGSIGRQILVFCQETGRMSILLVQILSHAPSVLKNHRLTVDQMMKIGVLSLPLVTVVSIFTGAVSSWQAAYQFRGLISLDFLGAAVSAAIFIELSPVLTGLVVAGRVGASIAAELGTMKVTERIIGDRSCPLSGRSPFYSGLDHHAGSGDLLEYCGSFWRLSGRKLSDGCQQICIFWECPAIFSHPQCDIRIG